jgi:hypothetical protein
MCSEMVVVGSAIYQNAAQLRFIEHDEVVETFAANQSDEALDWPFCHGECGGRMIADSHCPNAVSISWTECSVTITKQATRRFILGKGIGYLAGEPRGGRIGCHTDPD